MSETFRTAAVIATIVSAIYLALFAAAFSMARGNGFTAEQSIVGGADAAEYVALARTMLDEHRFALAPGGEAEYFRTPAYPAFIAVLLALFSTIVAIPITQCLLVGLSSGLIYLIGVRYFTGTIGGAAGLVYALDPRVITTAFVTLSDTLFVFLLLLTVYCLARDGRRALIIACIAAGLMVLTRPLGLYVLPLLAAWVGIVELPAWRRAVTLSIAFLAGSMLLIFPWMVRNAIHGHHTELSSLSAYNVLFFNVLDFEAQRRGIPKDEMRQELYDRLEVSDWRELRSFRYADAEHALTREYLSPHLVEYAVFHAVKTIPFFIGSSIDEGGRALYAFGARHGSPPPDVNISAQFLAGHYAEAARAVFANVPELIERVVWLAVWALSVACVAFSLLRRSSLAVTYAAFMVLCLAFAAMAGPIAMPRYRMPAAPFALLLAGQGMMYLLPVLARWLRHLKRPRVSPGS